MKILIIMLFALISSFSYAQTLMHIDKDAAYSHKPYGELLPLVNHDTITVYKQINKDYWSANLNGEVVYIKYWYLKELSEKHNVAVRKRNVAMAQNRRSEIIGKYGQENGNIINKGRVRIGFTKAMAIAAWGKPESVHKTILSNYVSEQWVYDGGYLYFTNGILSAIQN